MEQRGGERWREAVAKAEAEGAKAEVEAAKAEVTAAKAEAEATKAGAEATKAEAAAFFAEVAVSETKAPVAVKSAADSDGAKAAVGAMLIAGGGLAFGVSTGSIDLSSLPLEQLQFDAAAMWWESARATCAAAVGDAQAALGGVPAAMAETAAVAQAHASTVRLQLPVLPAARYLPPTLHPCPHRGAQVRAAPRLVGCDRLFRLKEFGAVSASHLSRQLWLGQAVSASQHKHQSIWGVG